MKTRIISAIIMIILGVPPLIYGGLPLKILLGVICALVCYEIAHIKENKVNYFLLVIEALFIFSFNFVLKGRIALIPLFLMALISLSIFKEDYKLTDAAISLS